jgi:simple sugar transport system permease protein
MILKALGLEIVKARDVHPIKQVLMVIAGILVALVVSGWFIWLDGHAPVEAFLVMIKGGFVGQRQITETLLRSAPLILTGLATVITFRAKIWSIGQEGQLLAGAMLSYSLYLVFQPILLRPALLAVIVVGGFLGGALLGLLSGLMKAYFNVDVIISTVMMNYIITTTLLFLLFDHKYWMGASTFYPRTDYLTEDAWYPILTSVGRLHMGFLIAIGLAILIYWILKKTPYGFDLRALGSNPVATEFKGINVNRMIVVTLFLSGGIAGLAGAGELFGVHHNLSMGLSPGFGSTGIIVAMIAELNPLIVILVGIIFGGLINGSVIMSAITGTNSTIISAIQAFLLVGVLISRALVKFRIRRITHVE